MNKLFKENFFPRFRKKANIVKRFHKPHKCHANNAKKWKREIFLGCLLNFLDVIEKGESSKRRWLESKKCSRKEFFRWWWYTIIGLLLKHQDSVLCIPWNTYKNTIWMCYKNAKTAFARKGTKLFLPFEGPIKSGSAYPMAFKLVCCGLLRNWNALFFAGVCVKWFSLKNVRSKLQLHQFQLFIELVFTCLMIKTVAEEKVL